MGTKTLEVDLSDPVSLRLAGFVIEKQLNILSQAAQFPQNLPKDVIYCRDFVAYAVGRFGYSVSQGGNAFRQTLYYFQRGDEVERGVIKLDIIDWQHFHALSRANPKGGRKHMPVMLAYLKEIGFVIPSSTA